RLERLPGEAEDEQVLLGVVGRHLERERRARPVVVWHHLHPGAAEHARVAPPRLGDRVEEAPDPAVEDGAFLARHAREGAERRRPGARPPTARAGLATIPATPARAPRTRRASWPRPPPSRTPRRGRSPPPRASPGTARRARAPRAPGRAPRGPPAARAARTRRPPRRLGSRPPRRRQRESRAPSPRRGPVPSLRCATGRRRHPPPPGASRRP